MHPCLNIVEVQQAIFREVYFQQRGDLASLARTCRAFNSNSLDVLWATLDSFALLVKCLPRDLWRIDPEDKEMVFQRPMTLKDWQVFFKYSCRVHVVEQSVGPEYITGCSDLGDDVIFSLSNPPSYGPLIPCLRTLHWNKPTNEYASLLRMLFTSSLVTISLSTSDCTLDSPEVTILTSIGPACPSLKSFCISSGTPFSDFLDINGEMVLSEAVMCMHSLESLVCPALDEEAFIHLSRLSTLSELSMELKYDFKLDSLLTPPAFGSINTLTLNVSSLSILTSTLESMQFSPSQVSFTVVNSPSLDAIRLFFIALVNACCSERLSQVSFSIANDEQYSPPPQHLTLSTFQPLFALPHIDTFELNLPRGISLDDADITTLARHWPKLTQLSINEKTGWGTSPHLTHQGLITLLSHCADLMQFALSVDFSGVDVPTSELLDSRPGNGVKNDNCLRATFVTSAISHPATIAAFLSDICPQLTTVKASWDQDIFISEEDPDSGEAYLDRWEEVEILLPAFTAVRRQCLGWVQMKTKEEDVVSA
ncbi:hypothetical protein BU15DRAFT_56395 [Melanogaster broomeanus]|nr:hypothetical protein BU15DRAFT_56395 [Melanogaster broomeanus]